MVLDGYIISRWIRKTVTFPHKKKARKRKLRKRSDAKELCI